MGKNLSSGCESEPLGNSIKKFELNCLLIKDLNEKKMLRYQIIRGGFKLRQSMDDVKDFLCSCLMLWVERV